MLSNRVLVFPRVIFDDVYSLLPWDSIQGQLDAIESSFSWLERPDAECSEGWVQAIPCAFIRDSTGKYCVLRRVHNNRDDLNKKLSLIVGGHIDESKNQGTFQSVMSRNLRRELNEEIGISSKESPRPVGIIVDNSSIQASRHVAFLHEMTADKVSLNAPEEFTTRSKFSGKFMDAADFVNKRDEFDPWSRLLIEEYVCPSIVRPQPRQRSFL